jgi:DNA-binding response OmpR family regulator
MKILVIEDDAESARYIAKGLRETGLVRSSMASAWWSACAARARPRGSCF